jgi:hypothetical protein
MQKKKKKIAMWWAETKINEKSPLKNYKSVLSASLLSQFNKKDIRLQNVFL